MAPNWIMFFRSGTKGKKDKQTFYLHFINQAVACHKGKTTSASEHKLHEGIISCT